MGIDAGLIWGQVADLTAVYIDFGISEGMQYGINHANNFGRSVVYRSIYVGAELISRYTTDIQESNHSTTINKDDVDNVER